MKYTLHHVRYKNFDKNNSIIFREREICLILIDVEARMKIFPNLLNTLDLNLIYIHDIEIKSLCKESLAHSIQNCFVKNILNV